MFTWSLGWAPSPARLAITSLAFMFDEVPEPVWKTSIGNWSSCLPAATSSPAAAIRSAISASSRPSSALTRAAAALIRRASGSPAPGSAARRPGSWRPPCSSPRPRARFQRPSRSSFLRLGLSRTLLSGSVSLPERALERRAERPTARAEAGRGVEAANEVGIGTGRVRAPSCTAPPGSRASPSPGRPGRAEPRRSAGWRPGSRSARRWRAHPLLVEAVADRGAAPSRTAPGAPGGRSVAGGRRQAGRRGRAWAIRAATGDEREHDRRRRMPPHARDAACYERLPGPGQRIILWQGR